MSIFPLESWKVIPGPGSVNTFFGSNSILEDFGENLNKKENSRIIPRFFFPPVVNRYFWFFRLESICYVVTEIYKFMDQGNFWHSLIRRFHWDYADFQHSPQIPRISLIISIVSPNLAINSKPVSHWPLSVPVPQQSHSLLSLRENHAFHSRTTPKWVRK